MVECYRLCKQFVTISIKLYSFCLTRHCHRYGCKITLLLYCDNIDFCCLSVPDWHSGTTLIWFIRISAHCLLDQ